jgi:hypothetical protein
MAVALHVKLGNDAGDRAKALIGNPMERLFVEEATVLKVKWSDE